MSARPLRVLARPGLRTAQNHYTSCLYGTMAGRAEVIDWTLPRAILGRWDILHIHWPETVFDHTLPEAMLTAGGLLRAIDLARRRGARLVWTLHNLRAHGQRHPEQEDAFRARFLDRLDGVLALTALGLAKARALYPVLQDVPAAVVPHPHYRGVYPDSIDRSEARNRLGLGAHERVFAFVGRIAAYKGLEHLVRAFGRLPDPDTRLVIAGRPLSEADRANAAGWAGADPRITLHADFVPDGALQTYFHAADCVVLPFEDILNSGSAILALSFGCPVVVPALGALAELSQQVGANWVRTYEGALTTEVLRGVLSSLPFARVPVEALSRLDPCSVADETLRAYRQFLSGPAPRRRRRSST